MRPANNIFGGGTAESVLGPAVLFLMLVVMVLMILLPRKLIVSPLMIGLFLFPTGETLVIGGLHFFVTRLLILVGIVRLMVSRPSDKRLSWAGLNSIDKVFLFWSVFHAAAFILTYGESGAVVKEGGLLWDALGGYFLMRFLIRKDVDIWLVIKTLAAIVTFLGITMLYEKMSAVNVYGLIAGYHLAPDIRNGSVRAQGPFHHAILAGTFAATSLPLVLLLFTSGKAKVLGLMGLFGSTVSVFCASSSTSVSTYLAAILAICFWPLRRGMRMVRWGVLVAILVLNVSMHAPVWWALEHIDFAGGSAGEHRAELIDNLVKHFGDWWLIGTKDNASWGYEMWDTSNQYVEEAESGGLVSLVCIATVITLCFKRVGRSRKSVQGSRTKEWYFFILGVALFAHAVAFFGITYFDQTRFSWYVLLAIISAATAPILTPKQVPASYRIFLDPVPSPYTASGFIADTSGRSRWE
jgi:hypothetical protein